MAVTLTTGGGVVLNDGVIYSLLGFNPGDTPRDETWIRPRVLGAAPLLAGYWDLETTCEITLRVKGTSVSNLQTRMNTVRNEFLTQGVNTAQGGDNFITWNPGGVARTIVTYACAIPAVVLTNEAAGIPYLYLAAGQFLVPRWTFQVKRQPYYAEDASNRRTPAI